jgi:uncharacterized RDD family membrane protein YckC
MIEKRPQSDFNPYQAPTAVLAPSAGAEGVGELASRGNRLDAAMGLVALVILLAWAAWNLVLIARHGQTQGKRWMNIRVERPDGTVATLPRIFLARGGVTYALSFIPVIGGLVSLVDTLMIFREDRRCLHDLIADTVVRNAPSQ